MIVQVEQLLCIFSVPNNRRKSACRKNRFNILNPLYEKGKTIRKALNFKVAQAFFSYSYLQPVRRSHESTCVCLCPFMNVGGRKGGM